MSALLVGLRRRADWVCGVDWFEIDALVQVCLRIWMGLQELEVRRQLVRAMEVPIIPT